jgi:hypothetical protein
MYNIESVLDKKQKMNKFMIMVLILFSVSCSDFLDEDLSTRITLENDAFATLEGLNDALAGAYKPLSYTWTMGFMNASLQGILMGSDDPTSSKFSNKPTFREFDQYIVSNTNICLPYIWNGCYKCIQGCNNIIANYQNVTGDEASIKQIAGEAYFLRAYCYFWIVRLWGEAPIVPESHIFNADDLSVRKSPTSEIYDQIVADMKMAEDLLADKKLQPGRVCKGTVKALLAETYLNMAGWPLNKTSYYALAASKAKELIDNEAAYGFGLMDDYAYLWPNAEQNFDGNKEEVFAINFWGHEYWSVNAVYGLAARPGEENGWDDYFCEITFFNQLPAGHRKDVTFQTQLEDGTPWQKFRTGRPYYKKLQGTKSDWQNAVSLPLERMAEVYLVYVEAQVMATGNNTDASALEAINKIVRRGAGLPFNTPNPAVDLTSATQDHIVQEKAWEFAGEYCRWFDLVRLQKVEEVIAKKDPDELQPRGPISYFMPVPAGETLINPDLAN